MKDIVYGGRAPIFLSLSLSLSGDLSLADVFLIDGCFVLSFFLLFFLSFFPFSLFFLLLSKTPTEMPLQT